MSNDVLNEFEKHPTDEDDEKPSNQNEDEDQRKQWEKQDQGINNDLNKAN